jgi:hypothetical protein
MMLTGLSTIMGNTLSCMASLVSDKTAHARSACFPQSWHKQSDSIGWPVLP